MDHEILLRWLANNDLETVAHASLLDLVKAALASLEQMADSDFEALNGGQEMLDELDEILAQLEEGGMAIASLEAFRDRYSLLSVVADSAAEALEDEYRRLAENLPDGEWCTENYVLVENGVDIYLDEGDDGPLLEALDTMSLVLESAYRPYREARIVDSEVSAESYVGHKLLQEGVECWLTALEMLRQEEDCPEESGWSDALRKAEEGNRLLIAVQRLNAQVQVEAARQSQRAR